MNPYPYSYSVANRTRSKTPTTANKGFNTWYKYNLPSARENIRQRAANVASSSSPMFASKAVYEEHLDDDDDDNYSSSSDIRVTDDSIECLGTPRTGSPTSTDVICLSSDDSYCHEAEDVAPETKRVKIEISDDDEYGPVGAKYCNNNLDANLRGNEVLEQLGELFSSSSCSDSNDDDSDDNDYGVGISDSIVPDSLYESESSGSLADETEQESDDESQETLARNSGKRNSSAERKKKSSKEAASKIKMITKEQIEKTSTDSSSHRRSKNRKGKEVSRKRKERDSSAFPSTGNAVKKKARKECPQADSIKQPPDDDEIMLVDDEEEHVLDDDDPRTNTSLTKAKEKEVWTKRKGSDKADRSEARFPSKAKADHHSTSRFPDKAKNSKRCSPAESVAEAKDRSRTSIPVRADKVKVSEGHSRAESTLKPKHRIKTSVSVTGNAEKAKARKERARDEFNKHPKDRCRTSIPATGNDDKARVREELARAGFNKHHKDHCRRSVPLTGNAEKAKASKVRPRAEFNKHPKDQCRTSISMTGNTEKAQASPRAKFIMHPKDRGSTSISVAGNATKAKARDKQARAESNTQLQDRTSTSVTVTGNAEKSKASNDCSRAESITQPAKDDSVSVKNEVKNEADDEYQSDGIQEKSGENVIKKKRYALDRGDYNAFKVLLDSIWLGGDIKQEPEIPVEVKPVEDELIYKFTFGVEEPEPDEKTAAEKECDELFAQMEFSLMTLEMGSQDCSTVTFKDLSASGEDRATLCRKGKHCLILDEEIGLQCRYCRLISQEIKDIIPPLGKRGWEDRDRPRYSYCPYIDPTMPEGLEFEFPDKDATTARRKPTATIWELIPEITSTMYPHQKEGFEFLWRNIAGSSNLEDLKNENFTGDPGGCIISHAPGTGKTRLTIVFLMTYMALFPESKPAVVAPAGMLLSWEDEFKKWNVDIPFHNLNNLEFSGKEDKIALSMFFAKSSRLRGKQDLIRMVKLYSWKKDGSVLGLSYSLYERLAWEKEGKKKKNTSGVAPKEAKMKKDVERILLELPGILVLDEGHMPRNKTSCIWQAISKVKTQKRVILSGTPFQNNFFELFNTMSIVRPAVAEMLSKNKRYHEILAAKKRVVGMSQDQYSSLQDGVAEENEIAMLKQEMEPFVHVHKGSILKERLPGLIDRVVVLEPPEIQKRLIEKIETNKNSFEFEHIAGREGQDIAARVLFSKQG